jgi:hypothetical protein
MARRIRTIRPKFPPRKIDVAEAVSSEFRSLNLPKPDEVWSIALEKPKEGDTLIEHVFEKEIIEKKRKALEHVLQRKTIQWQRTEEQIKLGLFPCILKLLLEETCVPRQGLHLTCDCTTFCRARNWNRT